MFIEFVCAKVKVLHRLYTSAALVCHDGKPNVIVSVGLITTDSRAESRFLLVRLLTVRWKKVRSESVNTSRSFPIPPQALPS